MIPLLIGAGIGLGKHVLEDLPQQRAQAELQARTAELSPWTGLKPQPVKQASALGSMMKFGGAGMAMGQNYQNMMNQKQMMQGAGFSPYDNMSQSPYGSMSYGQRPV